MYFSRTSGIAVFLFLHLVGIYKILGDNTLPKTIEEHQVGFFSYTSNLHSQHCFDLQIMPLEMMKYLFDRELTKCAVLGIGMLLLLLLLRMCQAKMEFCALHITQQIYIVFAPA